MLKTEALAAKFIDQSDVTVRCFNRDVTTMTDDELADAFVDTNLLINATTASSPCVRQSNRVEV